MKTLLKLIPSILAISVTVLAAAVIMNSVAVRRLRDEVAELRLAVEKAKSNTPPELPPTHQ